MERGLLWLPLLGLFVWLARAGWNEYQKVEAYRVWAEDFDKAKYDIYAVLGQKGSELVWGRPTPKGPVDLESLSLAEVRSLQLLVNQEAVDLENPPTKGKAIFLEFVLSDSKKVEIPFTDIDLAVRWGKYLGQQYSNN
ncbi:MAG: hypothetical protein F6K35_34830 [Okeania sp. SIO2H7]|nr:hypothetical protein [Okeania sp. SIO2H7]